jgi:hypothetical protein
MDCILQNLILLAFLIIFQPFCAAMDGGTPHFQKISGFISPNVPAVCDGLAARIRSLRSKDQGRQTVPEQWRGNEAKRNDLAIAEAEGL